MAESDWVRRVRKNQGLKGFELAALLDVSAARVSVIEKDEARGALTLRMMDKVAKAMGCRFEYQIVPDRSQQSSQVEIGEVLNPRSLNTKQSNSKPRYRVVENVE